MFDFLLFAYASSSTIIAVAAFIEIVTISHNILSKSYDSYLPIMFLLSWSVFSHPFSTKAEAYQITLRSSWSQSSSYINS